MRNTNEFHTNVSYDLIKAFTGNGVGSILDVQDYYENSVIKQHFRLVDQCRNPSINQIKRIVSLLGRVLILNISKVHYNML